MYAPDFFAITANISSLSAAAASAVFPLEYSTYFTSDAVKEEDHTFSFSAVSALLSVLPDTFTFLLSTFSPFRSEECAAYSW